MTNYSTFYSRMNGNYNHKNSFNMKWNIREIIPKNEVTKTQLCNITGKS